VSIEFPRKLECLFQPSRYKFLRGGRGGGKSWAVARALLLRAVQKPTRILCTREVQKSIKDSVHRLLSDQVESLGLEGFYEVLRDEIRGRNGSLFLFSGLSDQTADSIKSFEGCDIVWIEEAHSITERSLRILIPTIRKDGSEIWATYNPELETDPIYVMDQVEPRERAISVKINWSDNPWFPSELEEERRHAQKTMKPAMYAHIWEGECLPAVEGAIYADEMAGVSARVVRLPYDPMLKAHTVWDLGFNDAMAIGLVQRHASEIRLLDYIEGSHRVITDYVAEIKERRWNWGVDFLPHDGFAKRHQTGKSDAEVLKAQGRTVLATPNVDVEAGIRNARLVFPRVYFNSEGAGIPLLLEHLKRYRRNINRTTGEPGAPLHDSHSHGADMFRYLCLAAEQMTNDEWKPLNYGSLGIV